MRSGERSCQLSSISRTQAPFDESTSEGNRRHSRFALPQSGFHGPYLDVYVKSPSRRSYMSGIVGNRTQRWGDEDMQEVAIHQDTAVSPLQFAQQVNLGTRLRLHAVYTL